MLWWWFATKVRDAAWNEITTCEITAYNVLPYEISNIGRSKYFFLQWNTIMSFCLKKISMVVLK